MSAITYKNSAIVGKFIKEFKHETYRELGDRLLRLKWRPEEIEIPEEYAAIVMLRELGMAKKHTLKCLLRLRRDANTLTRWIWHIQAFTAAYPKYCHECNGSGRTYDPGYWDARAGEGLPESEDYCEHCIGQGNCPRCGAHVFTEDMSDEELSLCSSCGWTPKSETVPEESGAAFYCDCNKERW